MSTTTNPSDIETTVYSDTEIANGDPLVAAAYFERGRDLAHLGTGFVSYDNLIAHLEHAVETGDPTAHVPPEAARRLYGAEKVTVFELSATMEFDNE